MNPRERQEQWEEQYLAEWAAKAARSKGRATEEPLDPVRTAYQRDRDRVLHSKAFRRLKHKTQVFIDPEEDHFRTRLTHTLEVAQIARTIARALRLNEDLTEAIALAHDLGHPPFGHAGEQALDAAYREYVGDANFRHDEQSLRVVDFLEYHDGVRGLNLTWEVRDGIANHSKGRSNLADPSRRHASTLEGEVVRIADRVAYINHDIDDAIAAGILKAADLPDDCVRLLGNTHSRRISTMVIDIVTTSDGKHEVSMSSEISAATDCLKDYLFQNVYTNPHVRMDEITKAARVVRELFAYYMDHPADEPTSLPYDERARAQTICDFIAGMTDRFAITQYKQLFLPDASILGN